MNALVIIQVVGVLLATHVGQGIASDFAGYHTSLREYYERKRIDPIGCGDEPQFNWKLFRWRVAGGVMAALLSITGVSNVIQSGGQ